MTPQVNPNPNLGLGSGVRMQSGLSGQNPRWAISCVANVPQMRTQTLKGGERDSPRLMCATIDACYASVPEGAPVNPLNVILTVLLFVSGALTVILVLMHSGKGTGVSEMIASSLYNSGTGSGVLEKNLNRLTVITATVFVLSVVVMALTFPTGSLG